MFDFPDVKKTVYKRNFLRSSIFNIEFSEEIKWELHSDTISSMFKDKFPVKNNKISIGVNFSKNSKEEVNLKSDSNSFELKSIDNLSVLSFESNTMAIVFHGTSYVSFNNVKGIFNDLKDELLNKELVKYSIKRISERKINLIDFKSSQNDGLIFLKKLINSQLIGNIDYTPNSNYIKQSINSIIFEEEKAQLNIKYGYNRINDNIGQVILDMVMFLNCETPHNLSDRFEQTNEVLFRAFNWAITDEYRKILQDE